MERRLTPLPTLQKTSFKCAGTGKAALSPSLHFGFPSLSECIFLPNSGSYQFSPLCLEYCSVNSLSAFQSFRFIYSFVFKSFFFPGGVRVKPSRR